jgi:hypothetical protein
MRVRACTTSKSGSVPEPVLALPCGIEPQGNRSEPPGNRRRLSRSRTHALTGRTIRARVVHQKGYPGKFVVRRALLAKEIALEEIGQPALERWKHEQETAARR